jgi:predicted lipoprotein with Yx(FWY)xxD motif
MIVGVLALAAAMVWPPEVPPAVQTIAEAGRWVLRSNDPAMPLYTRDADPPGKSTCLAACRKSWPPLRAPADARPVGEWTVVTVTSGEHQWAFRGKPVYLHRGDEVSMPRGVAPGWRLLPTFPARR